MFTHLKIVDRYDRNIVRNADAAFIERLKDTDCQRISCNENRIGHIVSVKLEQLLRFSTTIEYCKRTRRKNKSVHGERQQTCPFVKSDRPRIPREKMCPHHVPISTDEGNARVPLLA